MNSHPRTFLALDARGDSYTIIVSPDASADRATLQTSNGRRVRKLSRGRYLVARGPVDKNDIEVVTDDPAAP